jgi:hypothetical protein
VSPSWLMMERKVVGARDDVWASVGSLSLLVPRKVFLRAANQDVHAHPSFLAPLGQLPKWCLQSDPLGLSYPSLGLAALQVNLRLYLHLGLPVSLLRRLSGHPPLTSSHPTPHQDMPPNHLLAIHPAPRTPRPMMNYLFSLLPSRCPVELANPGIFHVIMTLTSLFLPPTICVAFLSLLGCTLLILDILVIYINCFSFVNLQSVVKDTLWNRNVSLKQQPGCSRVDNCL